MAKILNYGSLNIDYVYDVPHFVKAGETLSSTNRSIFAGGKGLNQSVALARAGGNVYHAGAVGKDDSKILTDVLAEDKIDFSNIAKRDCLQVIQLSRLIPTVRTALSSLVVLIRQFLRLISTVLLPILRPVISWFCRMKPATSDI